MVKNMSLWAIPQHRYVQFFFFFSKDQINTPLLFIDYSWCVPEIPLCRIKSKNKSPVHHHHFMFPIWNPLWRSIQLPHVSSLHMSTTKRETPWTAIAVEKTETRCNNHTGSALLKETGMVCVCVHMTAENLPEHNGNIHSTFCF